MLKQTILDETVTPVVSNIWRASEVGDPCEAYLCHVRLGHQPEKMEGRVRHLLQDGNMHEDDIVRRLVSGGLDVLNSGDDQMYVHCISGPIKINGHPDGLLHNVPKELQELDWADEHFSWDSAYHLLEITAPNHFAFQRYANEHLRGVNWRKFVQTNLYVGSEELRDKMRCAVVIVKDKMNSTLYEEGLTFDKTIVDETVEKLKRVEDLCSRDEVSSYRCNDWHVKNCKFRQYCFTEEEAELSAPTKGYLDADKLLEAPELHEALESYLLSQEFKAMNEDARAYFGEMLEQYDAEGIIINGRKIKWTDSHWSGVDTELLRGTYPAVYAEVYRSKPTRFVSVGRG